MNESVPDYSTANAATMNVYGNASIRAKQQANSKLVEMVMKERQPQAGQERVAV